MLIINSHTHAYTEDDSWSIFKNYILSTGKFQITFILIFTSSLFSSLSRGSPKLVCFFNSQAFLRYQLHYVKMQACVQIDFFFLVDLQNSVIITTSQFKNVSITPVSCYMPFKVNPPLQRIPPFISTAINQSACSKTSHKQNFTVSTHQCSSV